MTASIRLFDLRTLFCYSAMRSAEGDGPPPNTE